MWGRSSKGRKAAVRRGQDQKAILQRYADEKAAAAGARNCWLPPKKKRVVKKQAAKRSKEATSDKPLVGPNRSARLIKAQVKRARKAKAIASKPRKPKA